ncbi:hypothetical protein IP70_19935 [alpha proteobacterium AAP38]|nr:hypothetical protein IP70_19935 [alpha proteobacterium AAP38]
MADESRLTLVLSDEGYDAAAAEEGISKLARIFGAMLARKHIEAASRARTAAAEAANGLPVAAIRAGIGHAVSDLRFGPAVGHRDTRPTEEQVKFALYRSPSEDDWTVQAEVSPMGSDARCDMLAIRCDDRIAIGVKMAWAGKEASNRPGQQVRDWERNLAGLEAMQGAGLATHGLFVLAFLHWQGSRAAGTLRKRVDGLRGSPVFPASSHPLPAWHGVNRVEFLVRRIF